MKNSENNAAAKSKGLRGHMGIVIILLNAVLLTCVVLLYIFYSNTYTRQLRIENLGNIANLNRSAAASMTSLFENWQTKLNDVAQYMQLHGMTYDEALQALSESNSSEDRYFELIGSDYTGHLARADSRGAYLPLDYSNNSYAPLHAVFDAAADGDPEGISFAPEFTDGGESAVKFFAIYRHIQLRDAQGQLQPYTLLLATRSSDVLALLNSQKSYTGQSSVLIDSMGNYIVSSRDYKSSNFFQYLYTYNDLTLDQMNAIRQEFLDNGSGELYYQNADVVVEDCVYRYEHMPMGDWYCVTCVPISAFHTPVYNTSYTLYLVGLLLLLFLIDMTWLQRMNRRLRASMLREREASAAKGNFMSRMSHEIRTPLNAVIGYNTIARNEMTEAKSDADYRQAEMKVMDCLLKSDIASKHLLTIINDVLDMSAIESGKISVAHDRFDFKGLITSLTTVFYSQARAKGVRFDVVFDTLTEEWFVGDQLRTNQILTNLLSNAIKFTPEGGSVTLKIQQPEADTNASHIHFEVTDTGIGMSEEYLSHIWTPFEQADSSISRRFGGTGLGLSITKNLVDLMGGDILVGSEPGVGTTFLVDLTFERTEQPQSADSLDFGAINALVVDDDTSTCDYIRMLFNRCGAKCAAVTSGQDALHAFTEALHQNEPFSLCLVDWQMPKMDGIETIRRIRDIAGGDLPIIVLTAYDYTELADKASEIGVSRFLAKPLFQSSLFDLLANIRGAAMPESMKRAPSVDFAGARVLLAEDNAMNMEIAVKIMRSAGLVVDSAWNGREAVDLFESSSAGTYMAILMDVHMPEMNGHEAAQAIRASSHPEAKTIPIIAMTADAFAENVAEARAAGMNDHISKPIDIPTLFATLKKYQ